MAPKIFMIIVLLLSIFTVDSKKKTIKDSTSVPDGNGLHPYSNGMNPGMAMRLEQTTV